MGRDQERREEFAAKRVVESIENANRRFMDGPNAPDGTCDYDLARDGQKVGAVEVTVLMDEGRQRLSQAIGKHAVQPAPELAQDWFVTLRHEDAGYSVRQVKASIRRALEQLERFGLDRFESPPWNFEKEEQLLIAHLPVRSARSYERTDGSEPARVFLIGPGAGATVWSGNTHDAIDEAIQGERFRGERAKLAASGSEEHHLFVWIDSTMLPAFVGIADGEGPLADRSVSLPNEIRVLWVAAPSANGVSVWRWSGSAWESFNLENDAVFPDRVHAPD